MNLHGFSKRIHPEWLRSCAGIPLGYFVLQRPTKEIKFACWRGYTRRRAFEYMQIVGHGKGSGYSVHTWIEINVEREGGRGWICGPCK